MGEDGSLTLDGSGQRRGDVRGGAELITESGFRRCISAPWLAWSLAVWDGGSGPDWPKMPRDDGPLLPLLGLPLHVLCVGASNVVHQTNSCEIRPRQQLRLGISTGFYPLDPDGILLQEPKVWCSAG